MAINQNDKQCAETFHPGYNHLKYNNQMPDVKGGRKQVETILTKDIRDIWYVVEVHPGASVKSRDGAQTLLSQPYVCYIVSYSTKILTSITNIGQTPPLLYPMTI